MSFGDKRGGFGGPREMHDAVCAECNEETKVPFKPSQGRPVYCRDCFQKQKGKGGGGGGRGRGDREMHDATCSDCGKDTQVPFKPSEGRPVYCRDCFQKNKPSRPRF